MSRRQIRRWTYRLAIQMTLTMILLLFGSMLMLENQNGWALYLLALAGVIAIKVMIELFILMFRVAGRGYDDGR